MTRKAAGSSALPGDEAIRSIPHARIVPAFRSKGRKIIDINLEAFRLGRDATEPVASA